MVNVVDMPIKCPVAPLEFCFLADWYFTDRGIRDKVEITYATPLDGAFTKPVASATLASLLEEKGVHLITEFNTGEVDGVGGKLVGYDGREVPFDLAVVVPLHSGADYVGRSEGLGDDLNFVPTNKSTLQTLAKENIFAIGDATNVPASKAGSVTHFEGEVLVDNIVRFLEGRDLSSTFDGHANCFIETGFGKALLIDFNYETEPLPGHFPSRVGMPLLKESRMNHLGKLMFQWFYWHALLQGRDVPGIGCRHARARQATPHPHTKPRPRGGISMSTATIAGTAVELNDEGFFVDPNQWTRDIAVEMAAADGITTMTDQHWQVIDFMRKEFFEKGTGPTVRVLGKTSGVSVKDLYLLFPKGPAKMAARIAGIPKPKGCI